MNQGILTMTDELITAVSNLTNNDDINLVIEAVKIARDKINSLTRLAFRVGESVTFTHKNSVISGKIKKINPKNILVKAESGMVWTIGPSLLEKVT